VVYEPPKTESVASAEIVINTKHDALKNISDTASNFAATKVDVLAQNIATNETLTSNTIDYVGVDYSEFTET
jgi:hypothetical protein